MIFVLVVLAIESTFCYIGCFTKLFVVHYGIEFSVNVAWDAALEFGQNKEF